MLGHILSKLGFIRKFVKFIFPCPIRINELSKNLGYRSFWYKKKKKIVIGIPMLQEIF